MKILFVTNYFPPHCIGGYELHCARVAEWLCRAGHSVEVLTSDFRLDNAAPEPAADHLTVHRDLELRYWTDVTDFAYWRREWRDVRRFRRCLCEGRPDIVILWNMAKLASGIVMEAQRRAPVLVYHLMDEWAANFRTANGLPQFWSRPARSLWGRAVKPLLRRIYRRVLTDDVSAWRPENAVLVSKALGDLMAQYGVAFERTHVSYITYDPALFGDSVEKHGKSERIGSADTPPPPSGAEEVRFLWAGRMCDGKGLTTTLDALDYLHATQPQGWTVDFCGPFGDDSDRLAFEKRLASAPWQGAVRYLGSLPHAAMPEQMRARDVFLFTSEVHEGLPGAIIEAFATGQAVIGTLTGGTKEVLRHDENCLVYPMGDATALAKTMRELIANPSLRQRLAQTGNRLAHEEYSNDAVFPKLIAFYKKR